MVPSATFFTEFFQLMMRLWHLGTKNKLLSLLDWLTTNKCCWIFAPDDENAKKRKFYLLNAKEIWKKAHLSGSDYKESNRAVQYINWTGSADLILECMNLAIESTSLGILKLTVIIERALGDVFVTIENERCPSLLKDLLQMEALRKLFGETLMTDLETLMGPPISLNLRNVLWHGFPMLGEIQPRYSIFSILSNSF